VGPPQDQPSIKSIVESRLVFESTDLNFECGCRWCHPSGTGLVSPNLSMESYVVSVCLIDAEWVCHLLTNTDTFTER
jgi:hypothetical protein